MNTTGIEAVWGLERNIRINVSPRNRGKWYSLNTQSGSKDWQRASPCWASSAKLIRAKLVRNKTNKSATPAGSGAINKICASDETHISDSTYEDRQIFAVSS